jgi:hypothetical protein
VEHLDKAAVEVARTAEHLLLARPRLAMWAQRQQLINRALEQFVECIDCEAPDDLARMLELQARTTSLEAWPCNKGD